MKYYGVKIQIGNLLINTFACSCYLYSVKLRKFGIQLYASFWLAAKFCKFEISCFQFSSFAVLLLPFRLRLIVLHRQAHLLYLYNTRHLNSR